VGNNAGNFSNRKKLPMSLSDTAIRATKPRDRQYKLADSDGLSLLVTPQGGKWWRFRYRYAGAEKMLSFGTYPEVGLREARDRRDSARKLVAAGIDPSSHRKQEKRENRATLGNTFAALANEWHGLKHATWAPATRDKIRFYLDSDLIPALGQRPVAEITRPELVDALRSIEKRQAFNVAKKARGWLNQIFRFALAKGLVDRNPATDLDVVAAPSPRAKPHPSLPLSELPSLLLAVQNYGGSPLTRFAIQLLLLTGVRPGELRHAPWSEFDLDRQLWSIPAERMKMRRPHLVPLPNQAIQFLHELNRITSYSKLLFPSRDDRDLPMSENTINAAFRRLGYNGKQTGHGFRHLISTALNEKGYNRDWVERQLAHGDEDEIRGVYNQAQYLEQRRTMMQDWADYVDKIQS
jgi:integrase